MFVPVDLLKPILAEMQQTGSTRVSRRPWLGLSSTEQGGRIQIVRVNKDSPAQQAGLAPGDFVLADRRGKVSTLESFYKRLWAQAGAGERGAADGAARRGGAAGDGEGGGPHENDARTRRDLT
jgi:S1-C subfamily serine protease